mmetsp:Transcript_148428/g.476682  ORF Transcript_148428/g.476682 Transcript_148428/m.476682 type:complete len:202 (+) Transcript_148428:496-1101(+)
MPGHAHGCVLPTFANMPGVARGQDGIGPDSRQHELQVQVPRHSSKLAATDQGRQQGALLRHHAVQVSAQSLPPSDDFENQALQTPAVTKPRCHPVLYQLLGLGIGEFGSSPTKNLPRPHPAVQMRNVIHRLEVGLERLDRVSDGEAWCQNKVLQIRRMLLERWLRARVCRHTEPEGQEIELDEEVGATAVSGVLPDGFQEP